MGSKGSSSSTSASSQAYSPAALPQIQDLYSRILNTSNTPYSPYDPNATVAPINAGQTQAIGNINNIANSNGGLGVASPYINQAQSYIQQGAAPITAAQIQGYENPFQSDVINSTLGTIQQNNALERQQLQGNSASQGGLGNERFYAAALPELARKQNMATNQTLAGLNYQNYQQALAAAQADAARQGQAGYAEGNLGTVAQGAALSGNQAALGASTVQQQNAQQLANAKLQEFMRAQGYPFQTTQFLAGLGLPALQAQGGTQTGTQTSSGSSTSGGGIGSALGILGGLFGADGGRVPGYASGGATQSPFEVANFPSYVPTIQAPALMPFPHFSDMKGGTSGAQQQGQNPQQLSDMIKKLRGGVNKAVGNLSNSNSPTDNPMDQQARTNTVDGTGNTDWNEAAPVGGGDPTELGQSGSADSFGMDGGGDMFSGGLDMSGDQTFSSGDMGGGDFPSVDAFGFKRGGSISGGSKSTFHVDSLIETAHKIKHGLRSMPKHFQTHGRKHFASGGEVEGPSDAFGFMPGAPENLPTKYDHLANRWGNISPFSHGSFGEKLFFLSDPDLNEKLSYGRFMSGQRQKYPTTQLDSPASMVQPMNDSMAAPVRAGVATSMPEEAMSGMDSEFNPFSTAAGRMERDAQRHARMSASHSRPSPERARQLGMRPNEIAGFNEATGEYSPSRNLYRGQTSDEAPMESVSPMGRQTEESSGRGESARQVSEGTYDEAPRRRSVDDSARAFLRNIYSQPPANEGTGLFSKMARTFQGPRPKLHEQVQAATNMMHYDTAREQLMPLGTDSNTGHPLLYDRRSGRTMDAITGKPLTGDEKVVGVGSSGKTPAQLVVAQALVSAREESRKSNPNLPPLAMEEAIMQAKRAPNDREGLAAVNARADLGFLKDPMGTLQKWRKIYGLPPEIGAPNIPTLQGASVSGASAPPGSPIMLSGSDPSWRQKYDALPSGSEFIFDGKKGRKP